VTVCRSNPLSDNRLLFSSVVQTYSPIHLLTGYCCSSPRVKRPERDAHQFLYLVQWLRISGAVMLLPIYTFRMPTATLSPVYLPDLSVAFSHVSPCLNCLVLQLSFYARPHWSISLFIPTHTNITHTHTSHTHTHHTHTHTSHTNTHHTSHTHTHTHTHITHTHTHHTHTHISTLCSRLSNSF
jgi:hypothetical protein